MHRKQEFAECWPACDLMSPWSACAHFTDEDVEANRVNLFLPPVHSSCGCGRDHSTQAMRKALLAASSSSVAAFLEGLFLPSGF